MLNLQTKKVASPLSKLPKIALLFPSAQRYHCQIFSTQSTSVSSSSSSDSFTQPNISSAPFTSTIKVFTQTRRFLQSLLLFKKLLLSSRPDILVLPPLLKSCSSLSCPSAGFCIHGYLIKSGFRYWVGTENSLIFMYMNLCGQARDARKLFDEMPVINLDIFNSLILGFRVNGFYDEVVDAFERMVLELGVSPNLDSICHVIMACGELGSIDKGMLVHDFVIVNGLRTHVPIANSLISMYVKMGRLDLGHQVFSDMCDRDIVSWNSLITGYTRNGEWAEAFDLFSLMRISGNWVPNNVTLLGLLSASGQGGNLDLGMSIHGHLVRSGLLSEFRLGTATVDMYAKCEQVDCARTLFEEDLPKRTLVSWNSLITGYSKNGYSQEAAMLYEQMIIESNMNPDSVTFANVVPAYASLLDHRKIQSIHSLIVKKALDMDGDVVLCTAMVDAYGKCSDVKAAKSFFTSIGTPTTATWNALIAAYNINHHAKEGLLHFLEMLQNKVLPDHITMVTLFQACGELGSLMQGSMIHGLCLSKGLSSDLMVENAIMDMYMRCKCPKGSEILFSSMSIKNMVTWNTMIHGYDRNENSAMAIRIFYQMQSEKNLAPDSVTMVAFLQASTAILASFSAEISHAYVSKLGFDSDTVVVNCLIDSYAKNGLIESAKTLFMQIGPLRDQSSWNVLIAGCGMNGQGRQACDLLSKMEEDGYKPNSITFTSLLSSCSHSGLIEEGCRLFEMMINIYKILPDMEHWTCIVDMLGRAGKLEEAYRIIESGSHLDSGSRLLSDCNAVWVALLSASRMSMNMELGRLSGEKLLELDSGNSMYHSLLSNLYASCKRWDEATKIRRVFGDGMLRKKPGLSITKI